MSDEHWKIDPRLEATGAGEDHNVACILKPTVRGQIWEGLKAGHSPDSLRPLAQPSSTAQPSEARTVGEGG